MVLPFLLGTGRLAATGPARAAACTAIPLSPTRRTPRPQIDTGREISSEIFPAVVSRA